MNLKAEAKECLEKGDYKGNYEFLKQEYENYKTEENRISYLNAEKMLNSYKKVEKFLKIDKNNYYKVLGLEEDCGEEDIRRSYRKLAMLYHPDANKIKESNEVFKIIQQAYSTLRDPKKREDYDNSRRNTHYRASSPFYSHSYPGDSPIFHQTGPWFYGGGDCSDIYRVLYGLHERDRVRNVRRRMEGVGIERPWDRDRIIIIFVLILLALIFQ
jgi:hypothetical protein